MRYRGLLFLLLGVGAPLTFFALASQARTTTSRPRKADSIREAAAWHGTSPATPQVADYVFALSQRIQVGSTPSFALEMSGAIELRVRRRDPAGATLGYRLHDVRLDLPGASSPDLREIARRLSVEILAEIDPRGRMGAISFPAGFEAQPRLWLQALLRSTQFVLPDSPAGEWQTIEEDTTGEYLAEYRQETGRIWKRKLRYHKITATREDLPIRPEEIRIRSEGWCRPDGLTPEELELEESVRIPLGEQEISVECIVRMKRLGFRPDVGDAPAAVDPASLRDDLTQAERETRRLRFRSRLTERKVTLEELLAKLDAHVRSGGDQRTLVELLEDAIALFAVDDTAVAAALDRIRSGTLHPDATRTLLNAMGASQSDPAQRALVQLISEDVGHDAILALALCERPLPETARALMAASADPRSEVAGSALLVLGVTAQRDPEQGEFSVKFLLERMTQAPDGDSRILILEAIGNSGHPATLDRLLEVSESGEEDVRAAAMHALRKIPGERVDTLLREKAISDESERTREASVRALAERGGSQQTLEQVVDADGSDRVRMTALRHFAGQAAANPAAREVVEKTARSNSSPEVRAFALDTLRSTPAPLPRNR